jgi:hypothetical protein
MFVWQLGAAALVSVYAEFSARLALSCRGYLHSNIYSLNHLLWASVDAFYNMRHHILGLV